MSFERPFALSRHASSASAFEASPESGAANSFHHDRSLSEDIDAWIEDINRPDPFWPSVFDRIEDVVRHIAELYSQ